MRESIQRAKRTHCDQGMIAASKRCLPARFDLLAAVMNARIMRNDPMLDSEILVERFVLGCVFMWWVYGLVIVRNFVIKFWHISATSNVLQNKTSNDDFVIFSWLITKFSMQALKPSLCCSQSHFNWVTTPCLSIIEKFLRLSVRRRMWGYHKCSASVAYISK